MEKVRFDIIGPGNIGTLHARSLPAGAASAQEKRQSGLLNPVVVAMRPALATYRHPSGETAHAGALRQPVAQENNPC